MISIASPIELITLSKPEEMKYNYGYKNSSEKRKFVNRIKRICRGSLEYKDYIAFLRDNVGMDACAFYNNITKATNKRIRIEVHHAPLCLEDIVQTVIKKWEDNGMQLNDLMISREIMNLHYSNLVGLIPLSKTLHEVVHNSDKLVIPTYMIFGDYKEFLKRYEVEDYILEKVENAIAATKELKENSFDFLEKKYTYLDIDGFTIPKRLEEPKKEKEEEKPEIEVEIADAA